MSRKKSQKSILEHYDCEGQLELEDMDFGDIEVFNPCNDCFRDHCVGCRFSCPDEYDAYQEMLNCLADGRSDF